jgi:hypothetical protein
MAVNFPTNSSLLNKKKGFGFPPQNRKYFNTNIVKDSSIGKQLEPKEMDFRSSLAGNFIDIPYLIN